LLSGFGKKNKTATPKRIIIGIRLFIFIFKVCFILYFVRHKIFITAVYSV
jgi:hypothetical protein